MYGTVHFYTTSSGSLKRHFSKGRGPKQPKNWREEWDYGLENEHTFIQSKCKKNPTKQNPKIFVKGRCL